MPDAEPVYCIATVRPWNLAFEISIRHFPGDWSLINAERPLSLEDLHRMKPGAIFFPRWNWKVPNKVVASFECIAFHAAPLPFGRGGSPIQNMIARGFSQTKLTAFRMNANFDDGDIYLQ